MSYDVLRNASRGILREIEGTKGYEGRIVIDEHPWGAIDMLSVSAVHNGQVVGALILWIDDGRRLLCLDRLDMTTFDRFTMDNFATENGEITAPEALSSRLRSMLRGYLGPTDAELVQQREALDLGARTRATRPRVTPQIIPAGDNGFNLMLYNLTANDVLRAVEALPEMIPPASSRTVYDHLLSDDL